MRGEGKEAGGKLNEEPRSVPRRFYFWSLGKMGRKGPRRGRNAGEKEGTWTKKRGLEREKVVLYRQQHGVAMKKTERGEGGWTIVKKEGGNRGEGEGKDMFVVKSLEKKKTRRLTTLSRCVIKYGFMFVGQHDYPAAKRKKKRKVT